MKKYLFNIYFTITMFACVLKSQQSNAQLNSITSQQKFKYYKTIAIKENDDIFGYVFLFEEEEDFVLSKVEYVITDIELNEIKRGLFSENIEDRPISNYTKAIKSNAQVYLFRNVIKPAENNALILPGGGFIGGMATGLLYSIFDDPNSANEVPLLEEFKKINLDDQKSAEEEGFFHFESTIENFNGSKVKLKTIKKRDFIFRLYPAEDGLLLIEQNLFEKSKGRADSIILYDNDFNFKWAYTMPNSFKNIKGFSPLIKEIASMGDNYLVHNCVEDKNRNFGNAILFLNKQKGSVVNELYIENKIHYDKIGYADFKFVFEDSLKTQILIASRALDEYKLDKTNGIFLSYLDKNLQLSKSKTILFKDLSKGLGEQYQDFFSGKHDIRINEVFWYNNKIYIIMQKKTAIGYSDIAFLIGDEDFDNFKVKIELQHSIGKMDYCTKPSILQEATFINIFRKKVSLSFKQLILIGESLTVRTNDNAITFDYDFAIDGKNSAIFCELKEGKTKIQMKKLSLFKG